MLRTCGLINDLMFVFNIDYISYLGIVTPYLKSRITFNSNRIRSSLSKCPPGQYKGGRTGRAFVSVLGLMIEMWKRGERWMCLRKPRSSGREYPSNTPPTIPHRHLLFLHSLERKRERETGRQGERERERGWQARRRRTVPSPLMFPSSSTGSSGEDNPRVRQCASSPGQSGPAGRSRCFFPNFCSICSLSRTFKNESAHPG